MRKSRDSSKRRSKGPLSPTADSPGLRTILLAGLFLCLLGMVVYFGGTNFWNSAPFWIPMLVICAGFLGFTVLRSRQVNRGLVLPPDFSFWPLLLLYVALRALFFSPVPFQTWTELMFLFSAWVLYGVMCDLGNQRSAQTVGSVLLLSVLLALSFLAISQHWNGSRAVLWEQRPAQYGVRASGTFICPNHYAHFLQMGMIVAYALLLTPKLKITLRIFAGYVLAPASVALLLSHSRSGILGAFAGVAVVSLGKALRTGWKRVTGVLLAVLAAGAGAVAAILNFYPPLAERLGNDLKYNIRYTQVWPDTWSMIQGEGFWGAGPGVYKDVFEKYREHFSNTTLYLEYAHNEYLNTLAEYGWLASAGMLILLGWMVCRWVRVTVTTASGPGAMIPITLLGLFAGTFIHALFDFNLHIPANAFLFVGLTGWLTGLGCYRSVWKTPPGRPLRLQLSAGAGIVGCLMLIPFLVRLGVGDWHEYRMRKSEDAEPMYAHAAKMRSWMPWEAKGWTALGDQKRKQAFWLLDPEEKTRLISESRAAYEQALRHNPYASHAVYGLLELAGLEQQPERELARVLQLRELDPFNHLYWIRHGLILIDLGRDDEALKVFEEAKRNHRGSSRQIDLNIARLKKKLQTK